MRPDGPLERAGRGPARAVNGAPWCLPFAWGTPGAGR